MYYFVNASCLVCGCGCGCVCVCVCMYVCMWVWVWVWVWVCVCVCVHVLCVYIYYVRILLKLHNIPDSLYWPKRYNTDWIVFKGSECSGRSWRWPHEFYFRTARFIYTHTHLSGIYIPIFHLFTRLRIYIFSVCIYLLCTHICRMFSTVGACMYMHLPNRYTRLHMQEQWCYLLIYIHTHTFIHTYIHAYIHTYIHAYM
jgi:hypothetical protein